MFFKCQNQKIDQFYWNSTVTKNAMNILIAFKQIEASSTEVCFSDRYWFVLTKIRNIECP